MLEAAGRLAADDGRRRFVLGLAPTVPREQVQAHLLRTAGGPAVDALNGRVRGATPRKTRLRRRIRA